MKLFSAALAMGAVGVAAQSKAARGGSSAQSGTQMEATGSSPVTRVVNLLKELEARIQSDAEVEQKAYDKFACWCETTSARKAAAIHKAKADLKSLGTEILEKKGLVATRAAEIAELAKNIADNEDQMAKATNIRQKENGAYMAETSETKQMVAALEQAIAVLSGAGSGGANRAEAEAKAVEIPELMQLSASSKNMIDAALAVADVSDAKAMEVRSFLESGSAYAPQSESIQGILKDMYTTFTNDIESLTASESKANTDFEELIATLTEENHHMLEEKTKKEAEKAEAEQQLAEATQAYEDTNAQMNADIEFFDETKKNCNAKADEWGTRVSMRDEELSGVKKALEILTSDEARDMFSKAIDDSGATSAKRVKAAEYSFVQLSASQKRGVNKAIGAVMKAAKATKSLRLAALTVTMRKTGHFDKVIKAIDDMIATLAEENTADIAKRDQCIEEYHQTDKKMAHEKWEIEVNEKKIEKFQSLIEKTQTEIEETIASIEETIEQLARMKEQRGEDKAAFEQALSDDEAAVSIMTDAIAALSSYFEKNIDGGVGDLQGNVKAFLQQGPAFEVSEDQAPETEFKGMGSNKGESRGVLSMMTMIKEDLEAEIKHGKATEKASIEAYNGAKKAAEKVKEDLENKKTNLEEKKAKLEKKKLDEQEAMAFNKAELKDEETYRAEITPDCDFIMGAFEERANRRVAEHEGLTQAKEFLAGMAESASVSLAQKSTVDDAAFGNAVRGFLARK